MKLYPNCVFANSLYINKCFQTSVFFGPGGQHLDQSKLVISGLHLSLFCRHDDFLLSLPAQTINKIGLNVSESNVVLLQCIRDLIT